MSDEEFVPEFGDYTKEDQEENPINVPTEVDEEFDLDALGELAPLEKIEEGAFSQVDPGKHVLQIKSVLFMNNGEEGATRYYLPMPDGTIKPVQCLSKMVSVTFSDPRKPNRTIRDTFSMPPADHTQKAGYLKGYTKEEKAVENDEGMGQGFWAKKLKQFVSHVGFPLGENGKIDARAFNPKNWEGRVIGCEVEKKPQRYLDKKTKAWVNKTAEEAWPNIKVLSYSTYVNPNKKAPTSPATAPAPEPSAPTEDAQKAAPKKSRQKA